uniref:Leucine rich immune protein (Coil-less) n=1 Tax=Anopheles atroparvus TaxID=41427 RepID=A0A182JLQ6_ANOAO
MFWPSLWFWTALVDTVNLRCNLLVCKLSDLDPQQESSFVFTYIPDTALCLSFENLLAGEVQQSFLHHASTLVKEVGILNSPAVRKIDISRHLNVSMLSIRKTSLATVNVDGENGALQHLTIRYSRLTRIPSELRHLHGVKLIDISDSPIDTMDLGIFCTTVALHTLRLIRNKIRLVAYSSRQPCSPIMEELDLRGNVLVVLNLELFGICTRLTSLDVSLNAVELVTGSFDNRVLTKLHMGGNRIKQLNFCQWNLPAIGELNLMHNMLSEVPRCIDRMSNLSVISFAFNNLTRFDMRSAAALPCLKRLDLSNNLLTSAALNDRLAFSPCLVELDVSYNFLTSLNLSYIPAHPSLRVCLCADDSICTLVLDHTLLKAQNGIVDAKECGVNQTAREA